MNEELKEFIRATIESVLLGDEFMEKFLTKMTIKLQQSKTAPPQPHHVSIKILDEDTGKPNAFQFTLSEKEGSEELDVTIHGIVDGEKVIIEDVDPGVIGLLKETIKEATSSGDVFSMNVLYWASLDAVPMENPSQG